MTNKLLLTAATALFMAACSQAETPQTVPAPETPLPTETSGESLPSMLNARGTLTGVDGAEIGSVNLIEGPNGVLLRVTVQPGSLEPGWHGLHLHAVGTCEDVGKFTASGGHHGKVEGAHGLLNPKGPEAGDLPNIWVAGDGSAGYEAFTRLTALDSLLDEDGSAIIIHEAEDDHLTQPIGGAGARVACGVIQ